LFDPLAYHVRYIPGIQTYFIPLYDKEGSKLG
jgi:hypothetical protein